jgi:hypothetical protein
MQPAADFGAPLCAACFLSSNGATCLYDEVHGTGRRPVDRNVRVTFPREDELFDSNLAARRVGQRVGGTVKR